MKKQDSKDLINHLYGNGDMPANLSKKILD